MTRLEVKRLAGGSPQVPPQLEDVSLTLESGQIAALFGPEHSGKRTLLRILCGLEQHSSGDILLGDSSIQHLSAHHRRVAAVFEDTPMFPGTVGENIVYGLERARWPSDDRERRVAEVLELVGMTGSEADRATALPAEERWRVALARAIAPAPPVLLIESPAWPVDEVSRPEFRTALRQILKSINLTTIIATADLRDAISIADDLHVMSGGQILQSGTLSRVLAGPASIRVAEMVGYHTLIRGNVTGNWIVEPGVGTVQFPEGFPLSGTARALAHPAAMLGVPDTSGLGIGVTGTVERIRAIGPTYLLDLRVGDRLIEVRWEWDPAPPPLGLATAIAVTPGTLRFFSDTSPSTVEADVEGADGTSDELRPRSRWGRRAAGPAATPEDETTSIGPGADATTNAVDAAAAGGASVAAAGIAAPPLAPPQPDPAGEEQAAPDWSAEWRASDVAPEPHSEEPAADTTSLGPAEVPPAPSEPGMSTATYEAPWFSASRPPSPAPAPPPAAPDDGGHPDAPPKTENSQRHQGMPLD